MEFTKPQAKKFIDIIHGFRAIAANKVQAWQLIRNECKKYNLQIPTLDQISGGDTYFFIDESELK